MELIETLKKKVMSGVPVSRQEAIQLIDAPLEALCAAADQIRRTFCGEKFDICAIINAKSGHCSEDCKYCAQSSHYHTGSEVYPLLSADKIVADAIDKMRRGVLRYSLVTSGKRLNTRETEEIAAIIRRIRAETEIEVCGSLGLLNREQFEILYEAGMHRVHNNLESSRRYFPSVCTTHSYDDKINSLKAAHEVGMSVCSGGIIGLGETMEDRIDMALTLRELGVSSIPVNILDPIPGTPYENNPRTTEEELMRVAAIYRFLLPEAAIRLAGGRGTIADKGKRVFQSGANAVITGDMLTTAGISIETDLQMIAELGYQEALIEA